MIPQGAPHATIPIFVPHVGCPHRCSFCDQNAISGSVRAPFPEEVQSLCRGALEELPKRYETAEIAFFGGSFTAIPQKQMISFLEAVQPLRSHPRFGGIRISTRPDAVGEEILSILSFYGVRAIELGAQSLYNEVLEANLRGHTAEDVRRASLLVRQKGFELGLQMMTGLYRSTPEMDWKTGLGIAALEPQTVRIYPTVVLRDTLLARLFAEKSYTPPSLSQTVELCARLMELLEGRGIRVIRLGLPFSRELQERALAGGLHPALGELCRSFSFCRRVEKALEGASGRVPVLVRVPPAALSQALGQKKQNLTFLRSRWPRLEIRPDPALAEGFTIDWDETGEKEVLYATSGH